MYIIGLLFSLFVAHAHAYPPEVPHFSQSEFRDEYGIFRWYEGCWFRIEGDYGCILPPNSAYGGGFGGIDFGSLGTGVFQFDGIVGNIGGFDGFTFGDGRNSSSFNDFSGFDSDGSSGGFSGFSGVDRFGARDNDGTTFRFSSGNNDGNGLSGGDGSAGGNGEGALGRPVGLGCDSIDDTRDGGILGPIPCTSYPGVLGPVPRY